MTSKSAETAPDSDIKTLLKYLTGGLAVGAGVGGVTSLVNHYKTMNDKARAAEDTSGDDDVLYVNLKRPVKTASSEMAKALGMAGAPVTGLLGYKMVRDLYQKFKREQLQKELDEAQNTYLDTMAPAEKQATTAGDTNWDLLLRSPIVVALLTAAGTGVLADRVMDKNFPAPKSPAGMRPKRLVFRDHPETPEEVAEKQASEDLDDGYEGLLRTVLEFPEVAAHSELPDLVKCAAAGLVGELLEASDKGIEHLWGFAKQAAATCQKEDRNLAIGWLVRDPELSEAVKLAAAIEFANACPTIMALARGADVETQEELVKLASEYCRAVRYSSKVKTPNVKSAYDLTDALKLGLEAGKPEDSLISGQSEDSTDSVPKSTSVEAEGAEAKELVSKNQDVIDDILEPKGPGTPRTKSVQHATPSAVAPAY